MLSEIFIFLFSIIIIVFVILILCQLKKKEYYSSSPISKPESIDNVIVNQNTVINLSIPQYGSPSISLQTPSVTPSEKSTQINLLMPSQIPSTTMPSTTIPSQMPSTIISSQMPSQMPSTTMPSTTMPSQMPTTMPSQMPSQMPSTTMPSTTMPSQMPSQIPTQMPSQIPSTMPSTTMPSQMPSQIPSQTPSLLPSEIPKTSMSPSQKQSTIMSSLTPIASLLASQLPSRIPIKFPSTCNKPEEIIPYIIKFIELISKSRYVKGIKPYFITKSDYFVLKFDHHHRFAVIILEPTHSNFVITSISYDIHVRSSKDIETTEVGFQLRNSEIMKDAIWYQYKNNSFNKFTYQFPKRILLNTKYIDSMLQKSFQFKIFNKDSAKIYINNLIVHGYEINKN